MALARAAAKAAREAAAMAAAGGYFPPPTARHNGGSDQGGSLLPSSRDRRASADDARPCLEADKGSEVLWEDEGEVPTAMAQAMERAQEQARLRDDKAAASRGAGSDEATRTFAVRSTKRIERLQKRERATERAEQVAAAASIAVPIKVKKPSLGQHDPSDPIRSYLREIGKTRLLTGLEEVQLSQGIQDLLKLERLSHSLAEELGRAPTLAEWSRAAGMEQTAFETRVKDGRACKDKMVLSNLRLVVSVAKKYQGRGMAFQDLIQEGSMGLIRGAEKFDHTKGFKFSTYAHWWIRQAVTRAIADQARTIRLPQQFGSAAADQVVNVRKGQVHLYEVISRINKAKKMLIQEHGRPPREDELAEIVGMPADKIRSILKAARIPVSMEKPVGKDGDQTLSECIADRDIESPEDAIAKRLLKQDLEAVLHTLNPRESEVMRLRYGLDDGRVKTLEEIGNIFRVTRERIRQIESKALRKLRQPSRNSVLRAYLEV
eukprot:SM000016S01937  [mRNA]  locus=s16:728202:730520:- [translate_table: standard]